MIFTLFYTFVFLQIPNLIKVPPHFFAVRPVRRLQRLVVLRADAGAEGIDIGSHWLPGFDGLGEM